MTECKILTRDEETAQGKSMLKRGGYARGGSINAAEDKTQDDNLVRSAVGQHETHDHKGEPKTKLKLKRGGMVKGEKPEPRADKFARGGATKHKGGGKGSVNIILPSAAEGEKRQAAAAGLQAGAKIGMAQAAKGMAGGAPHAPPGAAPGGPPPGGMPPPGAGMPPPGQPPMKRGGRAG